MRKQCEEIEEKIQMVKKSEEDLIDFYQPSKWKLNDILDCFFKTIELLDHSYQVFFHIYIKHFLLGYRTAAPVGTYSKFS